MTLQTRPFLTNEFRAGERPSGEDFRDLLESCVNKTTDGINTDLEGNFILQHGLQVGMSTATAPGGLRFNGAQLQVFTGGAWTALTTGGVGPFTQFSSTNVAFVTGLTSGACVGIGAFNGTTTQPTSSLLRPRMMPHLPCKDSST